MRLEEQIEELAALGMGLEPGISVEDLLLLWSRKQYESTPFQLLLAALGMEIGAGSAARLCSRAVWSFDTECIHQDGDYVAIVERLARMADASGRITNLTDHVDVNENEASLYYEIDGHPVDVQFDVEDDWADLLTLMNVMASFERPGKGGKRFYAQQSGQGLLLCFITAVDAARLNERVKEPFERFTPALNDD